MSIEAKIHAMQDQGGPYFPVSPDAEHPGVSVSDVIFIELIKEFRDVNDEVMKVAMHRARAIVQWKRLFDGRVEDLPSYQQGYADALEAVIKTLCPACAQGVAVKHGTHVQGRGECKAWGIHQLKG
jgi:hypothetical protein